MITLDTYSNKIMVTYSNNKLIINIWIIILCLDNHQVKRKSIQIFQQVKIIISIRIVMKEIVKEGNHLNKEKLLIPSNNNSNR